jgi:hypothetical protein
MKWHRFSFLLAATVALAGSTVCSAHHSYAEYDQQKTTEIEGTLSNVSWQNPHVRFTVAVPAAAGSTAMTWEIESSGINNLQRMGAQVGHFKVGSRVKVAGWPSRRGPGRMYVTNLLSQDGHELVLWRFSKLRWARSGAGYGTGADQRLFASGTPSQSTSLFRVWSSDYDDPDAAPEALMRTVRASPPPLTPAAAKARAAWDPTKNTGFAGCAPKGMPFIMAQPFPLELVDKGDSIEVRIEEYDVVRTIHMKPQRDVSSRPATPEGHSVGRWEGKSLVVTTSNITPRPFDDSGFMRSPAASLVERFTLSADGSRLHYTVMLTDPEVFTQPMELKRSWVWRPGEKVMPFNCKP